MKFKTNNRLLQILIGSNLYPSADVCVRELIQNAWDAITLRQTRGDGKGGRIRVAYSLRDRWFEVSDDGLGMNRNEVENSFLDVGQDKFKVLGGEQEGDHIGFFGIGILSVFLVASRVEVETMRQGEEAPKLRLVINNMEDEIPVTEIDDKGDPGTRIRVYLNSEAEFQPEKIPEIVSKYVRHVPGVQIFDHDNNKLHEAPEVWSVADLATYESATGILGVRAGKLGLSNAIFDAGVPLANFFTFCNGGFLVENQCNDLLPIPSIGLGGELDMAPRALNVSMNRSAFQRDELWANLGSDVLGWFAEYLQGQLSSGQLKPSDNLDDEKIRMALLTMYVRLPGHTLLEETRRIVSDRIFSTVPFEQSEGPSISLSKICSKLSDSRRVYFRSKATPNKETRTISDEGISFTITEEIKGGVIVGALRAKGFTVMETEQIRRNTQERNGVSNFIIDEAEVARTFLSEHGVQLLDIKKPLPEDLDLESIERLPLLRSAIDLDGRLRFAEIKNTNRRVVSDGAGHTYLNIGNPKIRELIELIPDAVNNPLKRRLLMAYLALEQFSVSEAREIIVELLRTPDLHSLASVRTAILTSAFVKEAVDHLIKEFADGS